MILKIGHKGDAVADWQRTLARLGFRGPAGQAIVDDGDFGKATEFATREFQKSRHIVADGAVGPESQKAALEDTDPDFVPAALIRGVDVSAFQGVVPWGMLAHLGFRFGLLRCSIGNENREDVKFDANVKAAREAGVAAGPYHFAYPLPHLDPRAQAQHAFKLADAGGHALGQQVGDMRPALDLEWPPPEKTGQTAGQEWKKWGCSARQILDWGLAYLEEAELLWGVKPLVYTYPYFWRCLSAAGGLDGYAPYPLWMADYRASGRVPKPTERPTVPKPWGPDSVVMWQHDGDGGLRLPNGADADFNVLLGGEEAFEELVLDRPAGVPVPNLDTLAGLSPSCLLTDADVCEYKRDRAEEA